jgi:hypothetical protein
MEEMFASSVRSSGDLAGVFEFDRDAGHLYLCRVGPGTDPRILEAICVSVGDPEYGDKDVVVRWSGDEKIVYVMIAGQIRAAFDCDTREHFGGMDRSGARLPVSAELLARIAR